MNYALLREIASEVTLEMMEEGDADQREIEALLHSWIVAQFGVRGDPEVDRIIREVVSSSLN